MNGIAVCSLIGLILYVLLYNWEFLQIFIIVYSLYLLLTLIYYPFGSRYNTTRKKVGLATWSEPYSPELYNCLKIRWENTSEFIDRINSVANVHVTPTHLVSKAIAEVVKDFPTLNGKLCFGLFVPYETIDISCLVAVDGGNDLGYMCFRSADTKSLTDISREAASQVKSVRTGEERKNLKAASMPFYLLPTCIGGVMLEVFSWVAVALGIDLKPFGVKKHPCGTAVITNVGAMGTEVVYAPFPPLLRIPMIFVMNSIREEVVVESGEMKVGKILNLAITFDHRFIDGGQVSAFQRRLKEILEDPERYIKI